MDEGGGGDGYGGQNEEDEKQKVEEEEVGRKVRQRVNFSAISRSVDLMLIP